MMRPHEAVKKRRRRMQLKMKQRVRMTMKQRARMTMKQERGDEKVQEELK